MGQSQALITEEERLRDSAGGGGQVQGRSPWQIFWTRFIGDRAAIAGFVLIVELVLIAVCAPLFAKLAGHGANQLFDNMTTDIGLPLGPNSHFWFGADTAGRDLFVRTMYGVRTSLIIALVSTGFSVIIGVGLGIVAGFFGGAIDTLISRAVDIVMSLPVLLFALGLAAACSIKPCLFGLIQPGLFLPVVIISAVNWTYIARIVRGQTISLREREFIEAARTLGSSNSRIMFREILPNLAAPIIVYSTLIIPSNILFEASLSFLGVGVPQQIPSLGRMLSDASGTQLFTVAWWMMVFPGLFLVLMTLAFNLVGDGLRDALDPRGSRAV